MTPRNTNLPMRTASMLVLLRLSYNENGNYTTLGNGYLGSRIDEERSEMRYVV